MASFWAKPEDVVARFERGEIQLAPPTHRTLEMIAHATGAEDALARLTAYSLEPICPRLVTHKDARGETIALTLPGDPEHDVTTARAPGTSRYVLRGERWLPEDAPR